MPHENVQASYTDYRHGRKPEGTACPWTGQRALAITAYSA